MTLQKDLKIFRFKNQNPTQQDPQKYDYQLFQNMQVVANTLSDGEFHMGKVSVVPGTLKMDLIRNTQNINFREMEDTDTFLLPITIVN
jgi:hypothetical protein